MDPAIRTILEKIGRECGTPCYVYFLPGIRRRIETTRRAFEGRFEISYAVKANPNPELLRCLTESADFFDVSSIGEVRRALEAGMAASRLSFSGPAKQEAELAEAVAVGVGLMVCESEWELQRLDSLGCSAGRRIPVLVRLNPAATLRGFGVPMSGRPSQFGIDEEDASAVLLRASESRFLDLQGLHVYAATNALATESILTSFELSLKMFAELIESCDLRPERLVFGAGFGIPYTPNEADLELEMVAAGMLSHWSSMRSNERLASANPVLELGRFLVGPEGYFLTSVIGEKSSRGVDIRLLDGGFNTHLAAYGLLGTVIRRNWPIWKVSGGDEEARDEVMLAGPLCTSIDVLANRIRLPPLRRGDILAVGSSGAYGLSASPTAFISHPSPEEYLVMDDEGLDIREVSEVS